MSSKRIKARRSSSVPQRGGARPGAGRPKEIGVTRQAKTKVVRVPVEYAYLFDKDHDGLTRFEKIMMLIHSWTTHSAFGSESSPRWEKFRQFLSELNRIIDGFWIV